MVKSITWNAAGLGDSVKRGLVFQEVRDMRGDVCFMQEVHCGSIDMADAWQIEWGGLAYFTDFSSARGGVGILFRKGMLPKIHAVDIDPLGAFIRLQCEMGGVEYTIVSAYVYGLGSKNI